MTVTLNNDRDDIVRRFARYVCIGIDMPLQNASITKSSTKMTMTYNVLMQHYTVKNKRQAKNKSPVFGQYGARA